MSATPNVKVDLTQNLKSLHLPTIRQCYEEVARQAERETLSYERYLHELVQRECDERAENRTTKMLRESQLPLEKSLEAYLREGGNCVSANFSIRQPEHTYLNQRAGFTEDTFYSVTFVSVRRNL